MRTRTALSIAVLLVSYAGFFIWNVPAAWLVGRVDVRLRPLGAVVSDARGSAWHGRGELALGGMPVGTLTWRARPWALVHGGVEAVVRVHGPQIVVRARIRAGGGVRLEDLEGRAALPFLARLVDLPTALDGTLVAHVRQASLSADGMLESAAGRLEAHGARLPDLGVALGTLVLQLQPTHGGVHALLRNRGGDLTLSGVLGLGADGRYRLRAVLTPHAGRDRIRDALAAVLGPPDAAGRFHYAVAGRLRR